MRRLYVTDTGNDPDLTEVDLVHYEGCGQIGAHTLCGHTDRTVWRWAETKKRVNCIGCVAVRNHVLGKSGAH